MGDRPDGRSPVACLRQVPRRSCRAARPRFVRHDQHWLLNLRGTDRGDAASVIAALGGAVRTVVGDIANLRLPTGPPEPTGGSALGRVRQPSAHGTSVPGFGTGAMRSVPQADCLISSEVGVLTAWESRLQPQSSLGGKGSRVNYMDVIRLEGCSSSRRGSRGV